MGNIDLRAYVFLDSLQAQHAAFLGTVAQGFLPLAGDASLILEVSPGIEINRLTDIALKTTAVKPGMQIVERLLRHARDPLATRRRRSAAAGAAILAEIGVAETDRIKPRILSSQIIRRIDDHQAQLVNRTAPRADDHPRRSRSTSSSWSQRPTRRWPPTRRRRRPTSTSSRCVTSARSGRVYLGGEERDIDVGWRAALAAIEGLEGREAKS